MKALLGHHGLRGDLAINLPAIRFAHEVLGLEVDMPIHRDFADMAPLFLNSPFLNSVFITDEYEAFPNEQDRQGLKARKYDHVFNPMQPHLIDRWHDHMTQSAAVLFDYFRLELPAAYQQIELTRWFRTPVLRKTIAFAPFAGSYNPQNKKRLSVENAQKIVDFILAKGYSVIKLGGPNEPELIGADNQVTDYFESVRRMLGCEFLLHSDTGLGWVCSGYKHPQIGVYFHSYYGEDKVHNIQPVNPNGVYLSSENVNNQNLLDKLFPILDNRLK